MIERYYNKD